MSKRAPWLDSALQCHAAGRLADAERICSEALRANSGEADALNILGIIAAYRRRFETAENSIGRAISLIPERGDFHAALGNVFMMQDRPDKMAQCYRRALLLARFRSVPAPFAEIAAHAGSLPHSGAFLSHLSRYRSQCLQDVYLDRWVFEGMRGGVFADIGAHDGITYSNSYFFESVRGWTGICIEPNPDVFARLTANRRCQALQCCVAAEEGIVPFRKLSGHSEMLSGIAANYHPEHRERIERELKEFGGDSLTIDVPARTFPGIAAASGLSVIDYLSIDTEGGELGILRTIPFERLRVHAISVECNFEDERAPMESFLKQRGYDLEIVLGSDLIFVHREWRRSRPSAP
jgi:FkbM family methyltransferase